MDNEGVELSEQEKFKPLTSQHETSSSEIYSKFNKKKCIYFCKVDGNDDNPNSVCCCGRPKKEHRKDEIQNGNSVSLWDVKQHVNKLSTDAYGQIEFEQHESTNDLTAEYIRLSDDDSVEDVLKLLIDGWKLTRPKLLISAIGGKKDFSLPSKYEQHLEADLSKISEDTDAWVITGGTNGGVTKQVGRMLQGIPCIGIASWGNVEHRDRLCEKLNSTVSYPMPHRMERKKTCLDNNHTHFLLVDNGTVGKLDIEKEFRRKLEKEIINHYEVPGVILVLNGEQDTLKQVKEAINEDPPIPVVVIKDSGGVADLLAFAHDISLEEGKKRDDGLEELLKLITKTFPDFDDDTIYEVCKNLLFTAEEREMITICKIKERFDIEKAIITALFKGGLAENNFKLALKWNRADVVRSFILPQNPQWSDSFLNEQMKKALVNDRPDFVELLLLEQRFNLKLFLTVDKLEFLYGVGARSKSSNMKQLLNEEMNAFSIPLNEIKDVVTKLTTSNTSKWVDNSNRRVGSPFTHLLIWAVLNNMHKMAMVFWETGKEAVAMAQLAYKLYMGLAKKFSENNSLKANAKEFKNLGLDKLRYFSEDKANNWKRALSISSSSKELFSKFHKKSCNKFLKKDNEDPNSDCYCGRPKSDHRKDALQSNSSETETSWKSKSHTESCPTNAYGRIKFHGGNGVRKTRARYTRLSDDDSVEDVLKLLLEEWNLKPPKLLISAIGGKRDFSLKKKFKFREGLFKFATTTDAWVITGGTNTGVMKQVGRALQGTPTRNRVSPSGEGHGSVPCIGIAPWGNVEHREKLCQESESTINYHMLHRKGRKGAYLDNNHTHFLLVDDGTVGKYDIEREFRRKVEKAIIKRFNVPAVLLVLNGGQHTVGQIENAITQDHPIPVFSIKGSGGTADLLSVAYDIPQEEGEQRDRQLKHLREMIENIFPHIGTQNILEHLQSLLNCICEENRTLVTIGKASNVDKSITTAVLNSEGTSSSVENNLKLALTWNRADIARSFIFTQNPKWSGSFLNDIMMVALEENRSDFVELLLEQGFDLKCFLIIDRLEILYKIRSMTGNNIMTNVFKEKKDTLSIPLDEVEKIFTEWTTLDTGNWLDSNKNVKNPSNMLFIWAVLNNMQKMAFLFWKNGGEPMAKALIACKLYLEMELRAEKYGLKDDITIQSFRNNQTEFQDCAVNLLDQCFSTDEQISHNLLKYELTNWGNSTCLRLARYSNHESFIAHACSQKVLDGIWTGAMAFRNHESLKTLSCIFIPTLVPTLEFCKKSEIPGLELKQTEFKQFYSAPITKFWGNVLSYLVFLGIFTYVVLGKLTTKLQNEEIVLIVFVVSLTTEEIRQIVQSDSIKHWGQDKWNICDAIAILLFYVGLGFRLNPSTIGPGHVIWSIDIIMWIIRLLEIFSFNKNLGPYVVMIEKMFKDLLYFLLIMAIFLSAYGVARQALLDPVSPTSWRSVVEIFFTPYWQTYGELFLHEDHLHSSTTTLFDTKKYNQYSEPIVSVLMALYMLVANILLLNLLIAIFNNTYAEVQRNSERIWKFQRYDVIVQYTKRPFFAPPFVIVNHVCLLCKRIYRKLDSAYLQYRNKDNPPGKRNKRMKVFLSEKSLSDLLHFEEECLVELLTRDDLPLTTEEKTKEELKNEIREAAMKISSLEVAEEKTKQELKNEIRETAVKIGSLEVAEEKAKEELHEEIKQSMEKATRKTTNLDMQEKETKQKLQEIKNSMKEMQISNQEMAMQINKESQENMRKTATKISSLEDKLERVLKILNQSADIGGRDNDDILDTAL
eukprot:gene9475-10465_t